MDKHNKPLRAMSYEDYGISKERYLELKHFCLQYRKKKEKLGYGVSGVQYDGMPHAPNVGNPTMREAIRNTMNRRDCEIIEQAAIETSSVLYPYILASVTTGDAYEYLGDVPVCKNDFYGYRRLFFFNLDQKKMNF